VNKYTVLCHSPRSRLRYAATVRALQADAFSSGLRRLAMTALLITSGQSEGDQNGEEAATSDSVHDGCRSVVMVDCVQEPPAPVAAPANSLRATKQYLDARRLRQAQAQAGLNAIEITGERPTQAPPDPWENFRQSVSSAAVSDCFAPSVQGGLLRLPWLLVQSAAGKCR
jgi:hypothetical protein